MGSFFFPARIKPSKRGRSSSLEAEAAENWLLWLSPTEVRHKAGMLSENFWLVT